jgi:hypothetical protein
LGLNPAYNLFGQSDEALCLNVIMCESLLRIWK